MKWERWIPCTAFTVVAVVATAQSYRFKIDPDKSFTDGYMQIRLWTSGSFRGDFDPESNLKGTRTKPGFEGDFMTTENDAVLTKPFWEFTRSDVFHTSGSFDLSVDLDNHRATVEAYKAERLAAGPIALSAQCLLNNEPFRTLSPLRTFEPNTTAFDAGRVELHRFIVTQRPGARTGSVVDLGNGWYRVSVTFMADVELDLLDLEQSAPLKFPMALSLVGNFQKTTDGASFGFPKGQGGDNLSREVDIPLDDFPVIVPAGKDSEGKYLRARVRMLANIGKIALTINGLRQFSATGTPIPLGRTSLESPGPSGPVPPRSTPQI